jgi:hypothetical protein
LVWKLMPISNQYNDFRHQFNWTVQLQVLLRLMFNYMWIFIILCEIFGLFLNLYVGDRCCYRPIKILTLIMARADYRYLDCSGRSGRPNWNPIDLKGVVPKLAMWRCVRNVP